MSRYPSPRPRATRLLVLPCSARKQLKPAWPVAAWWRYDGVLIRLCRALSRAGRFPADVRLRILSAEHGIILPVTLIPWYDRRMDAARAVALRPAVAAALEAAVRGERTGEVFMALGRRYHEAAVLFTPRVPVHRPIASIGTMQMLLRSWLLTGQGPPGGQLSLPLPRPGGR